MALDAHSAVHRFTVLFFNCMLTFGTYFCFDMPSVLQTQFTCSLTCSNTTMTSALSNITTSPMASIVSEPEMCGGDCLGMTESQYNLLYAIYAWPNAVAVIGAGVLTDNLGIRVGLFLFSSLSLVASILFAVGTYFKGTLALLPIMLFSRLLFGIGNGSLTIVQDRVTVFWFKDKELALAFGATLAFSRLGSVLNFLLTAAFNDAFGLKWTLWGGIMLIGLGFISAIIVTILHKTGSEQLEVSGEIKTQPKRVNFSDIRQFTLSYWLLCLTIMFFCNGVFPFVADASKFISVKYGYPPDSKTPSYIAGTIYDCCAILSPFAGAIIDIVGKRGYITVLCATLALPVFGILAFTTWYPLVITIWLGISYAIATTSTWPSIPLVVNDSVIATALGIASSIQMTGVGICNLIVGLILGDEKKLNTDEQLTRWKYVMIFLLCNIIACVLAAVFLNINDRRNNGILNISRSERREVNKDETDRLIPLGGAQASLEAVDANKD